MASFLVISSILTVFQRARLFLRCGTERPSCRSKVHSLSKASDKGFKCREKSTLSNEDVGNQMVWVTLVVFDCGSSNQIVRFPKFIGGSVLLSDEGAKADRSILSGYEIKTFILLSLLLRF